MKDCLISFNDMYQFDKAPELSSLPLFRLACAQWCYYCNEGGLGKNNIKTFFKILYLRTKCSKSQTCFDREEKGLFRIYLDRQNDWGLIFPVVKEFDKCDIKYFLVLSEECYQNHQPELSQLHNARIQLDKQYLPRKDWMLTIDDFKQAFAFSKAMKKICTVSFSFADSLAFISLVLVNIAIARGEYVLYYSSCKFALSLGNWEYGYLKQLYHIKAYGMQHGHYTYKDVSYQPIFHPDNVSCFFTFGDFYSKLFNDYYHVQCKAVGNDIFSPIRKPFNRESKKFIFFSSYWYDESERYKRIKDTIKDLLELKDRFPYLDIYVKLHPNENGQVYEEDPSFRGSGIKLVNGTIDSKNLLEDVYMAVSWQSTVNLEAIKMGGIAIQLKNHIPTKNIQSFSFQCDSLDQIYELIADKEKALRLHESQIREADEFFVYNSSPTRDISKILVADCASVH